LGLFPFYSWVPDVYEGSYLFVTYFFAIIGKFVFLIVFFKFFLRFDSFFLFLQPLFFLVSILSLFVGSIGACVQFKIKRFIGYSSIANTGLLLLLFSFFSLDLLGIILVYLFFYVFSYSLLFFSFFLIQFMRFPLKEISLWSDVAALRRSNFLLLLFITLLLFSFAGLPPLPGFWIKLYVIFAFVYFKSFFLLFLFFFFSIISGYYYLRLIFLFYFTTIQVTFFKPIPFFSAFLFVLVFNCFFFLFMLLPSSFQISLFSFFLFFNFFKIFFF